MLTIVGIVNRFVMAGKHARGAAAVAAVAAAPGDDGGLLATHRRMVVAVACAAGVCGRRAAARFWFCGCVSDKRWAAARAVLLGVLLGAMPACYPKQPAYTPADAVQATNAALVELLADGVSPSPPPPPLLLLLLHVGGGYSWRTRARTPAAAPRAAYGHRAVPARAQPREGNNGLHVALCLCGLVLQCSHIDTMLSGWSPLCARNG